MYNVVAIVNNTVCTNAESCCTPETNVMLYVNYTSIEKKKAIQVVHSFLIQRL